MKPPLFSLLHATYGRPEKAVAAYRKTMALAMDPTGVEYIFACNNDDSKPIDGANFLGADLCANTFIVPGNFNGSAPAWNAAANESLGKILIQMQDDLELPLHWDISLTNAILRAGITNLDDPFFVAVSDGFRNDGICCTAIMNRARYQQEGEFLHPGYMSVFSDDDVTYRAYRDAKIGKCKLVDARDLVFTHRHHYHDKTVPMDATYERENSSDAYRIGSELFVQRNPLAATDGIRTWR